MEKKYTVARGYPGIMYSLILMAVCFLTLCLRWYRDDDGKLIINILSIIGYLIVCASVLSAVYHLLFDAFFGRFSVDESGITMYTAFKKWYHPWETIPYCGTTWTRTANDGGMYCVFFATRLLSTVEKQKFLWKTRKDLVNIAYFQYSKETIAELYPILPPEIAAKVKESVDLVESSMNNFERRHHK